MADPLARYRAKRDFTRTGEPTGAAPDPSGGSRFVVQRHRASRLHYDVRLEIDGVLVSWAVPKGPTLDANVRRAAFHVEDHPVEYFDFEGVIPRGEYGGGDVVVWDVGTYSYEPGHGSRTPGGAMRKGELHVDLDGAKLRGRFVFVRTRQSGKAEEWLLLHKHDDFAVDGWDAEEYSRSVLTGRTNDEVQADPDRLWRSDLPASSAAVVLRPSPATDEELDELTGLGSSGTWHVFGRSVRVSGLDREVVPGRRGGRAVTQRELLAYAGSIAPAVAPYLSGRAVTGHRYPKGIDGRPATVATLPSRAPRWLPRRDGSPIVVDEPAALAWLVNSGALDWSVSAAAVGNAERPTRVAIALTPSGRASWHDVLARAALVRTALDHLGLVSCPVVDGAYGLAVWIPIAPGPSSDDVRGWVSRLDASVGSVAAESGAAPVEVGVADPAAVPFAPRSRAGAPVAVPVGWADLEGTRPDSWTVRTVGERLATSGDPLAPLLRRAQRLPPLD